MSELLPKLQHKKHPYYGVWCAIKARCYSKNSKDYANYGGRGIVMCDSWKNSFPSFVNDMGERPYKGTIDRIDNNGNYELSNCRWVSQKHQTRNTRNNILIEYMGEKSTLTEMAEKYNVQYHTVYGRLKRGLPLDRVFSPVLLRGGQWGKKGQEGMKQFRG